MHLNLQQLHAPEWAQKGYDLPKFDVERVRAAAPLRALTSSMTVFLSRTVLLPAGQDMKEP